MLVAFIKPTTIARKPATKIPPFIKVPISILPIIFIAQAISNKLAPIDNIILPKLAASFDMDFVDCIAIIIIPKNAATANPPLIRTSVSICPNIATTPASNSKEILIFRIILPKALLCSDTLDVNVIIIPKIVRKVTIAMPPLTRVSVFIDPNIYIAAAKKSNEVLNFLIILPNCAISFIPINLVKIIRIAIIPKNALTAIPPCINLFRSIPPKILTAAAIRIRAIPRLRIMEPKRAISMLEPSLFILDIN